jgi:hypothetical protein
VNFMSWLLLITYVYVMIYDCPNLIIIAYNYRMYSALPTSPELYPSELPSMIAKIIHKTAWGNHCTFGR